MELAYAHVITLVTALLSGVLLMILARYLKIPAIVPLLLGGVILGPEVSGIIHPETLGAGMRLLISLAVATILFEGGLTLNPAGFKQASNMIWRLLTVGVLITWWGTALSVYLLFNVSVNMALLTGSLIIVTGPTVINPLLRRICIKEKIHHILHWEGVLIDPIGVFIAILCFELLSLDAVNAIDPYQQFLYRIGIGNFLGLVFGMVVYQILTQKWFPEEYVNIFVLAMALFAFGISDLIANEAGLLTVIVMGLVLGIKKPPTLKHIVQFKSELTEMSIAVLFVLLAAKLKLHQFLEMGWEGFVLILIVLFVIRPLSIMICSYGTSLSYKERIFLSWMAPRGIVAGAMASLFALELSVMGYKNVSFLETFTFSIIGVTVLFQGLSAGFVAKILKLKIKVKTGWAIVGVHDFSKKIATFIMENTQNVCILVDSNAAAVQEAQHEGYLAFNGDARMEDALPHEIRSTIGNLLVLTDNRDLNQVISGKWSELLTPDHIFRWSPLNENQEIKIGGKGIPIWSELPKPSIVSYRLKKREAILVRGQFQSISSKITTGSVLLAFAAEQNIFVHTLPLENQLQGNVVLFQERAHHLPFFIHTSHVLDLQVADAQTLLMILLREATNSHPELPYEKLLNALIERETTFPTVLPNHVAIPHAYSSTLKEPLCMIARVPQGINWFGDSNENYKLIFLLLSSEKDPELHLILLAEIAKLTSNPETVKQLTVAKTPEDVIECLKKFEAE
ncbi:cation:proton antiporter [Deltaproteobacteria bacterium TL4]